MGCMLVVLDLTLAFRAILPFLPFCSVRMKRQLRTFHILCVGVLEMLGCMQGCSRHLNTFLLNSIQQDDNLYDSGIGDVNLPVH